MTRHIWPIFLLASGLVWCGCQQPANGPRLVTVAATPSVDTVRPEKRTVERTLLLTGDLRPYQEARLFSKISGYLKSVAVDIGDPVHPGQLLATIESPELDADRAKAQAEVAAAQADVRGSQAEATQAQAGFREAQAETLVAAAHIREVSTQELAASAAANLSRQKLQRLEAVYREDPGSVALQDLDIARAEASQSQSQVKTAQARRQIAEREYQASRTRVESAQANLQVRSARVDNQSEASQVKSRQWESSQVMVGYQEIRSPFQGFVVARNLDPGALVQAAANSAQNQIVPILIVADPRRLRLALQIPESEAASVLVGTPAQVEVADSPPLQTRVSRTSGALDADTRTMRAEIDLPNPGLRLKPGMMARVRLRLERHTGVWALPPAAILTDKGKQSVWIVEAGQARKQPINTGLEDERAVEIRQGIEGGEQVVTEGKEQLSSKGGPVKVRQAH